MKPLLLISVVTLFLMACHKDEVVEDKPNLFPIKYYFINTSPNVIWSVNMTAYTYFPEVNQTNIHYKNFSNVATQDSLLIRVDTSSVTKSWGYVGCQTQLELNVMERRPGSMLYISTWQTDRGEIQSEADAQVFFTWPGDTVRATKISSRFVKEL